MDGNVIAHASPRDMVTVSNTSQARKDTDTNNFHVESGDGELFGIPAEIWDIFEPESKTVRMNAVSTQ